MKSTFLPLLLYVISFSAFNTIGALCRHGEYLSTDNECCPMCNIGLVVLRDCMGDYSTTCIPCTEGTFIDVPNGLNKCFPCKTCDRGLYTLQNCSTIKDTVCEVLDGYYCAQLSNRECSLAMKHSECKPGEQIKTPGTRFSDTVCETCPSEFYSPEGVRCFNWTDCSLTNEIVDEEGTPIRDVKCKPTWTTFIVIAAVLTTAVLLLLFLFLYWKHRVRDVTPCLFLSCLRYHFCSSCPIIKHLFTTTTSESILGSQKIKSSCRGNNFFKSRLCITTQ